MCTKIFNLIGRKLDEMRLRECKITIVKSLVTVNLQVGSTVILMLIVELLLAWRILKLALESCISLLSVLSCRLASAINVLAP